MWPLSSSEAQDNFQQPPKDSCRHLSLFLRCFPGSLSLLLFLFPALPSSSSSIQKIAAGTHPLDACAKLPTFLLPPSDSLHDSHFPWAVPTKSSLRGCLLAPSSLESQLLQFWAGKNQAPGFGYQDLCPPLRSPFVLARILSGAVTIWTLEEESGASLCKVSVFELRKLRPERCHNLLKDPEEVPG